MTSPQTPTAVADTLPPRRIPLYQALWRSFFDAHIYRDVATRRDGILAGYLALLLFIAWLPPMMSFQLALSDFVGGLGLRLIADLPRIEIDDGEATVDPPGLHAISVPGDDEPFFIVDLDGSVEKYQAERRNLIVLTRTNLITVRASRTDVRALDLALFDGVRIDRDDAARLLRVAEFAIVPILFPLLWLFSFIFRLVQVMIYGLIAMYVGQSRRLKTFDHAAGVRIAVLAITPVVVIDTLFARLEIAIPSWIFLAIAMGFILFGVYACRRPDESSPVAGGLDGT